MNVRPLVVPLLSLLAACGPADVTQLTFRAAVGQAPFTCGTSFQLGTPATAYRPRDFRLYVHDVALIAEDGTSTPFVLADEAPWQRAGVAMLDFEDRTGDCNGTAETRTVLKGLAAGAPYRKLAFTLGVPFAQNHQDAAAAQAPLASTAMFWNWMAGYKFLRVDGFTTGLAAGHNLHLGSTGCTAGAQPNSVASCANENRPRVTLDFDPARDTVVLDLVPLFSGVNLDTNMASSAPGCMSAPTDLDCTAVFGHLGLPFNGQPASAQTFFRVE